MPKREGRDADILVGSSNFCLEPWNHRNSLPKVWSCQGSEKDVYDLNLSKTVGKVFQTGLEAGIKWEPFGLIG